MGRERLHCDYKKTIVVVVQAVSQLMGTAISFRALGIILVQTLLSFFSPLWRRNANKCEGPAVSHP